MAKKQKWSQLTNEQKSALKRKGKLNSCGGKYSHPLIPNFIFTDSCNQHDFYYERGGDIIDKLEGDLMFVAHMIKQINDHYDRWYKKLPLTFVAVFVYLPAVTVLGLLGFEWGQYRSFDDILGT
jgi:hypothetical protein